MIIVSVVLALILIRISLIVNGSDDIGKAHDIDKDSCIIGMKGFNISDDSS